MEYMVLGTQETASDVELDEALREILNSGDARMIHLAEEAHRRIKLQRRAFDAVKQVLRRDCGNGDGNAPQNIPFPRG